MEFVILERIKSIFSIFAWKSLRESGMFDFKKLIVKYLRELADKIDTGTSEVSETEAVDILSIISHQVMSKEQACSYLNLSRSRFDDLVREKKLPKGRKRVGFKEIVFYRDELDIAAKKLRNKK